MSKRINISKGYRIGGFHHEVGYETEFINWVKRWFQVSHGLSTPAYADSAVKAGQICAFGTVEINEIQYYPNVMSKKSSIPSRAFSLHQWYRRPLGQRLAATEIAALDKQLLNLFGYHLFIVDPPWESCHLENSRIPHHVTQRIVSGAGTGDHVMGETETWPVLTDSLDAILLPHTLELAHDPHQVLREADRCLIPDGHLVILGFNPISLWGLRRLVSRNKRQMPWETKFVSLHRIKDWLSLLGFDTLHTQYLFHRLPFQNMKLFDKIKFSETHADRSMLTAGAYLLVARKRTTILTPIKPALANKRRLFPVSIPSSSQRNFRRAG